MQHFTIMNDASQYQYHGRDRSFYNEQHYHKNELMKMDSNDHNSNNKNFSLTTSTSSTMEDIHNIQQSLPIEQQGQTPASRCHHRDHHFELISHHHGDSCKRRRTSSSSSSSSSSSCYSRLNARELQSLYKNLLQQQQQQQPGGKRKRGVTFSESSSMSVYDPDSRYECTKSYSKKDRRHFGVEVVTEAVRIRRRILLLSTSLHSNGIHCSSVQDLLKNNVISPEEIAGIEHLVLSNSNSASSAAQWIYHRKAHVRAVLVEQSRLQQQQRLQEDNHGIHMNREEASRRLAEFSTLSSSDSSLRARAHASTVA